MPSVLAGLRHPIVQAPMAGGPSTPQLAAAVTEAGGLGFLAAAYRSPDAVAADLAAVPRPYGLNVFVPNWPEPAPGVVERYAARLDGELGQPRHDDDGFDAKVALAAEHRVPAVSFTFGVPPAAAVERLRAAGCEVWMTVTSPAEAREAAAGGADVLVLQGTEAGGHRGGFDDTAPADLSVLALVQLVAAEDLGLPLVAAGGIATGAAAGALRAAGAAAVQAGTAFMRCPEAGTAPAHREALATGEATALTRAFTGRLARGVVNRFMREHDADAPAAAYPDVHHLTAPLRAAARAAGDTDNFHLWAGQAHRLARDEPAADVVRRLADPRDGLPRLHISVRDAGEADGGWITERQRRTWDGDFVERLGERVELPGLPALVAEAAGRPAGLLTYAVRGDDAEVVTLEAFLRGAGQPLLATAAERARAAGARRLWLVTGATNLTAIRTYQRAGFAVRAVHGRDLVLDRPL